ncbi:AtpZ/AtpI family protein [Crocinitomix algicola]|uniref:AtpZ/AtpI family protein n=1 Tax=Crocinitomix algicola TaxID=1740263 RepID=UPI00083760B7|nr:AtpZ/AtpI family protein [Crocinitomix algicola]
MKNNYVKFSAVGIQMAVVIIAGAFGGNALDEKYQTEKPVWTIVFSLLGVAIGLYLVIKEVINLNKDDEKKDHQNGN